MDMPTVRYILLSYIVTSKYKQITEDGNLCLGFRFYDTHGHPEDKFGFKFDIACYRDGEEKYAKKAKSEPNQVFSHPGILATYIEDKLIDFADDIAETFLFDHIKNEDEQRKAIKGLGQMVAYAARVFARQHRNFFFTVSMTPKIARLLRWDRSGVVVSAAFEYHNCDTLSKFFWCFSRMTDAERGCDTTVMQATEAEEELFRTAVTCHVKSQLGKDIPNLQEEVGRHYERGSRQDSSTIFGR